MGNVALTVEIPKQYRDMFMDTAMNMGISTAELFVKLIRGVAVRDSGEDGFRGEIEAHSYDQNEAMKILNDMKSGKNVTVYENAEEYLKQL
jgi:hypothetical protein